MTNDFEKAAQGVGAYILYWGGLIAFLMGIAYAGRLIWQVLGAL